jgi:hypothetical protein
MRLSCRRRSGKHGSWCASNPRDGRGKLIALTDLPLSLTKAEQEALNALLKKPVAGL